MPSSGSEAEAGAIIVVSGLPRSGTSMLMRMLERGGLELLTDGARPPDEDNPLGYFELDAVKRTEVDRSWVPRARGRAVKVVSPLLAHLPDGESYRILFMIRDVSEVLASQREMLRRRGEPLPTAIEDAALARSFERHLAGVRERLANRPGFDTLFLSHREVVGRPRQAVERIVRFLGRALEVESMACAVDRRLHRQRS